MAIDTTLGVISQDAFDEMTSTSSAISFETARQELGVPVIAEALEAFLDENFAPVSNVSYQGVGNAAFLFSTFAIPPVFTLTDGILLSSGAFPGDANTSTGSSLSTGGPAGDTDLDAVALAAFPNAGETFDASIIEFDIVVTNPEIDGFSIDIVFGSEEFPEFSDSSFVDVGAVIVNGVNFALFNNDPTQPLSVIDENLQNGNFINNDTAGGGDFEDGEFEEGDFGEGEFDGVAPIETSVDGDGFPTELDGFSDVLTVRAPLEQGLNTIKIGVADTGDTIFDSILAIANFEFLLGGGTGGGVLQVKDGGEGDDDIDATEAQEEINLFTGADSVKGTAEQLDGDIITGFGEDDDLTIIDSFFGDEDFTVTLGSAILDIDTDGDGEADTTITLEGDFEGAEFSAVQTDEGTQINVEFPALLNEVLGTDGNDRLTGSDGADRIVSGAGRIDRMSGGDGPDQFVFGAETMNGVRERDLISDFTADDMIVLEGGASIANVRDTARGVFVQFAGDDRDAIIITGDVSAESLQIISDEGFVA